ncbi:MAG: ABC transporter permease [Synergistaceae bacterium]|jgi:simple sugar transport system permease protein|nr:ABC transporter permease [Synergistaceae bacterium]
MSGSARRGGLPGASTAWTRFLEVMSGDKTSHIAIPLFSVALSMVAASLLLLALGENPLVAMAAFLRGSGFMVKPSYAGGQSALTDFLSFLGILAPMLLAALSVAAALRAGMFNIGVAGQMLAAGYVATILAGYADMAPALARPLVVLLGLSVGATMGAAVGFLKYRFNIHEVVSTIMFNYITSYVTGFLINTHYSDAITRSSRVCSRAARLTVTGIDVGGLRLTFPIGILIALAAAAIMKFVLDRTTVGFELKAVGLNRDAARYAGISVGRVTVFAMSVSGALAGLAGVTYYLGYYNNIMPKTLASLGFDAIAVALLGNLNPVGSIFSSILVTIFQKGSVYMSSTLGAPQEVASVITSVMLLFSACGACVRFHAARMLEKLAGRGGSDEGGGG